ncbi:glycosyltransferase family 4 protein [Novosphingobium sp. M1R2S20]|uniref:Glycosyltransferase family 4 protein n=1 Tax=Novosphingobium rhizovicinum TaxID=3228928 RepID=A0ABV3RHR5_9SPHN
MLMARSRTPSIAFVLQGLGAGGSEHVVSQLCNHFAGKGWKVTLLAFDDRDTEPYYAHHPAVQVMPLGLKSKRQGPLAAAGYYRERLKLLRSAFQFVAPDLVVSFLTRTNVLSVLAAGRNGPPVLVSERNNPALQTVGPIWELLRRRTYARAVGLVTMTEGAMRHFPASMRKRAFVIPNPSTLPPAAAQRNAGQPTIGAVGRLVPQKGFDRLIEAFGRCAAQIPEWRLIIWGEGPERASLEAQRDHLGLTDRILLPGVTREAGGWIGATDVFVLSSRFEGWGLVLSEAMAAGLPVISTDCEWGPSDMIEPGKSGVLVRNGDEAALAAALVQVCGNEELRTSLGDAARKRMTAFEPSRVLKLWETTIEQLIDENMKAMR